MLLGGFGVFVGVMGMGSHREIDIFIGFREPADHWKSINPGRNRNHPLKPGGAGALDYRVALGLEIGKIKMAMTVDQHGGSF